MSQFPSSDSNPNRYSQRPGQPQSNAFPQRPEFRPRAPQPAQPAAAKPKRKNLAGRIVVFGFIAAVGLFFGVAEAFSSSPPSPFQQCVTSIQAETSSQIIGYTPQCMALPLDQRLAAIKQATNG
jgi:hypothetical protein